MKGYSQVYIPRLAPDKAIGKVFARTHTIISAPPEDFRVSGNPFTSLDAAGTRLLRSGEFLHPRSSMGTPVSVSKPPFSIRQAARFPSLVKCSHGGLTRKMSFLGARVPQSPASAVRLQPSASAVERSREESFAFF